MNKKWITLLLAALTALLFACSKDDVENPDDPNVPLGPEYTDPDIERTISLIVTTDGRDRIDLEFMPREEEDSIIRQYLHEPILPPQDLYIDWGDGTLTHSATHKYANEGTYNVTIKAKNLKWFNCNSSEVQEIDLQECKSLLCLILGSDKLNYIELSECKALKFLFSWSSELTSLDISNCQSLIFLNCKRSKYLASMKLDNPALETLKCYECDLTSLDVSKCPNLKYLNCRGNENLTSMKLDNPNLGTIDCYNCALTSLDASNCPNIKELDCRHNNLSANALNKIFNALPNRYGQIGIYGNPGEETCDTNIAENKGWNVY